MHERETKTRSFDEEEKEQMWTAGFKQPIAVSFALTLTNVCVITDWRKVKKKKKKTANPSCKIHMFTVYTLYCLTQMVYKHLTVGIFYSHRCEKEWRLMIHSFLMRQ